jgi:hypothetical protein
MFFYVVGAKVIQILVTQQIKSDFKKILPPSFPSHFPLPIPEKYFICIGGGTPHLYIIADNVRFTKIVSKSLIV